MVDYLSATYLLIIDLTKEKRKPHSLDPNGRQNGWLFCMDVGRYSSVQVFCITRLEGYKPKSADATLGGKTRLLPNDLAVGGQLCGPVNKENKAGNQSSRPVVYPVSEIGEHAPDPGTHSSSSYGS